MSYIPVAFKAFKGNELLRFGFLVCFEAVWDSSLGLPSVSTAIARSSKPIKHGLGLNECRILLSDSLYISFVIRFEENAKWDTPKLTTTTYPTRPKQKTKQSPIPQTDFWEREMLQIPLHHPQRKKRERELSKYHPTTPKTIPSHAHHHHSSSPARHDPAHHANPPPPLPGPSAAAVFPGPGAAALAC